MTGPNYADNIMVFDQLNEAEIIEFEITDVIDLHPFSPKEIKYLLADCLEEWIKRGYKEVRIIHGKGQGTLKATVRSWLLKCPEVLSFRDGDETSGGWGATIVRLRG